jgi:CubicO group peptidase (beta-lactamase class C family)
LTPEEVATRVVADRVAPVCAAGYASRTARWRSETGGSGELFFDLASLTKSVTAVAVACSGLDRATPLAALVPEARGTPSENASLELLLAHRAGLAAHVALYEPLLRGERLAIGDALRAAASARQPSARGDVPRDGFAPLYSDIGYILAGVALARHLDARDAGEAVGRLVLEPLAIASRLGTIQDLAARNVFGPFAPTEDVAWRGGRIVGAVHDENAWALTGLGGSGHAGLFGTIDGVLGFAARVLDAIDGRSSPLGPVDLEWLVTPRPGGTLRAGFDGKSPEGSTAGNRAGPRSFGHLGFAGTSLWIDPDARIISTLLTNRVFEGRDPAAIRKARPWAHDALWDRADQMSSDPP